MYVSECINVYFWLYLPKLLIEVRSVDLSLLVTFLVIKVQIPANKKWAQELLHFHSNIEWDGDDEVIEDQKCQEVRDELQNLKENEANEQMLSKEQDKKKSRIW